jgi:single-stranded-DNA-specific exonuclease
MTTSASVASKLAYELEQVNFHRKSRSAQVLAEAYDAITRQRDWQEQTLFAVHHERWETGLVGAVASRLVEEVRRPVFLFHEEDGMLVGSARSVDGFNLVDTLREAAPLLHRFGGHSLAAGLSLAKENLPHLESHIADAIGRLEMRIPSPRQLRIDANLPPEYLKLGTVSEISRMEPFGRGNDQPLLRITDADLLQYSVMGADRSHLKIQAKTGGRQIEAISWSGAWRSQELVARRHIDLVGKLEINRWNGQERLQLVLEDFRAQ